MARGRRGNGIIITVRGDLTRLGYRLKERSAKKRRQALKKAVRKYGYANVVRKVNALAVLMKNTHPTYAKRARSDVEWLKKTYGR